MSKLEQTTNTVTAEQSAVISASAECGSKECGLKECGSKERKSAERGPVDPIPANRAPSQGGNAENPMLTGVIWQQLLIFFVPLLAGTFFQMLYNTVDAVIVGRFVGKLALSAVGGATATLINLFVGLFVSITSGVTVVVSQYYGAKREAELQKAIHTGISLAVLLGLVLTIVVFALAGPMLRAMNTPEETLAQSEVYLRIYACGMIGNMLYNTGASILRAVGDSRRPFLYLVIGTVSNIILDLFFIIVLHLGVAGAALATILSQYASAVGAFLFLLRTDSVVRVFPGKLHLDAFFAWKILQIGIPAAFRSLMYSFSNVLIQTSINGFGTDTVAAWTVWGKVDAVFWMIINSLGIATTTVVGQNYGAGRKDRVRKCARQALAITALFNVVLCAVILLGRSFFVRIFTSDPDVIRQSIEIAEFMAPVFITYIAIEIFSGVLQGMGDALIPTIITILGVCVIRIVWIYTFVPAHHSMKSVMASYPISWTISSIAFFIYYEWYVQRHRIR